MKLFTIGHSTHNLQEFLAILAAHQITQLIDVRTIPKSRRVPWFNREVLSVELRRKKIRYVHLPELGGLRHTHKGSINPGWRNASFRGFADYMQTPEFYAGLKKLNALIKKGGKTAIMCAEAVPWRCHRSLIADAETIRHIAVTHIFTQTHTQPHQLTAFAVVNRHKRPIKIYYVKY